MTPKQNNKRFKENYKTAWWNKPNTFNEKIIIHYNTDIAPLHHFQMTKVLTRKILLRVFENTMKTTNTTLFRSSHHFMTIPHYYIPSKLTDTLAMVCTKCKNANESGNTEVITRIRDKQHFLFPTSMITSLLDLRTIWCIECDEQLFKWYSESECPVCNPY